MQPTVFCFGEPLLRIMPDAEGSGARIFRGGAELNVAAALSKWEFSTQYLTALPENALADQYISFIAENGIGTDRILRRGERVGTYYLLGGTDLRNQVVYDRKYSSFGMLKAGEVNWSELLDENGWLHLTTINPSLSDDMMDVCLELTEAALAKNMKISIDLNYRPALWKNRTVDTAAFRKLISRAYLLFGNIWSAEQLLGIPVTQDITPTSGVNTICEAAGVCAAEIRNFAPGIRYCAFSFRFTEQLPGKYLATIHDADDYAVSQIHTIENIIDKVGSGDSCMAGLIAGCIQNRDMQEIIDFAAASAVSKLGQEGDWNRYSAYQIEKLIDKVV